MKIEFNQQNGLLTMQGTAIEPKDRSLLREFFQHEIPGYDHSLQYRYNEAEDSYTLQFVPTLTADNLRKEFGEKLQESTNADGDAVWQVTVSTVALLIRKDSGWYEILAITTNEVIESGSGMHIYHVRELVKKMNGYAGAYR